MKQLDFYGSKRITWPGLLAVFVCGCLLLSLGRLYANNLGTLITTMLVGPLACAAAGLVLFQTDLARRLEFRLLLGILAVVFLSSMLNEKFYGAFADNRNDLFVLATLIFACFALCFVLPKERRSSSLNGLIDVSAAVVAVTALIGVALAASGRYVRPAFLPEYGIGVCPENVVMGADGRLVLFTHPNSVGMICEVVLLLSVYRILTARRPAVQWLHGASAVVCYCALALAASRTATIATAGGLGLYAFRLVLLGGRPTGNTRRITRWIGAIAALIAVFLAAFLLNGLLCDLLLSFSPENAASAAAVTAAERDLLEDIGMFTGRTNIWKGALQAMRLTPRLFLIGSSPVRVGAAVSDYTPIYAQELHNSFMQTLVGGGVFCLLLFLLFLVLLAVCCVRAFFTKVATASDGASAGIDPGWLPAPLAAILVNACMETFLLIYPQLVFTSVWFFILAGYAFCLGRRGKDEAAL